MLKQPGKLAPPASLSAPCGISTKVIACGTLWLEHYPGMTERELARIVDEAGKRWPFVQALVIHRVGRIEPDETIVLVAIWSAHRAAALEATREIIEELKHRAPFWKKETLNPHAVRWVERNTPG